MPLTVKLSISNTLSFTGRPQFISSVKTNMTVKRGEDRRHMMHYSTQIRNVLIISFNRILSKNGTHMLEELIDSLLCNLKQRGIKFNRAKDLVSKIEKVLTLAFSKEENLVIGSAVYNQGIEQARKSINFIKRKLDEYCSIDDLRSFKEIKVKVIDLIKTTIINTTKIEGRDESRKVAKYRIEILELLTESIEAVDNVYTLIEILSCFEFSCTLDIVNDSSSKNQNNWAINRSNELQQAIREQNDQVILKILL